MRINTQSGYSLIQTVVAIGLFAIVGMGIASILSDSYMGSRRNSVQLTRTSIINNVRFNASNFIAMNRSALENRKEGKNSQLVSCVCGKKACATNVKYEASLYDVAGVKIAGTSEEPRFYNVYGDSCVKDSEDCLFQATAQFECVGSNCSDASAATDSDPVLRVSYSIKPIDESRVSSLGAMPEVNGPSVDITAKSIRTYALENNLCVQVTGFAPNTGSDTGGTEVVFQGSGLTDVNSVLIGSKDCVISSKSLLSLTCVTPSQSVGFYDVQVNYGNAQEPEKILIKRGFAYISSGSGGSEEKKCMWHPTGPCTACDLEDNSIQLPPCIEGNQGEKTETGGKIYECRC